MNHDSDSAQSNCARRVVARPAPTCAPTRCLGDPAFFANLTWASKDIFVLPLVVWRRLCLRTMLRSKQHIAVRVKERLRNKVQEDGVDLALRRSRHMLRQGLSCWIVALAVSPFTAPFRTCDLSALLAKHAEAEHGPQATNLDADAGITVASSIAWLHPSEPPVTGRARFVVGPPSASLAISCLLFDAASQSPLGMHLKPFRAPNGVLDGILRI